MIAIVIMLGFGLVGYFVAKSKGKQPILWAVICALFPLIGLIILAFLRPEISTAQSSPSYDLMAFDRAAPLQKTPAPALTLPADGKEAVYDTKKWGALVQIDKDIAEAVSKVRAVGDRYVDQLAAAYLTLNDKSYLAAIVDKVLEKARDDLRKQEALSADDPARAAKIADQNAALADERRQFAETSRDVIKADGGIDPVSGKRVIDATIYAGAAAQWNGSLKLLFEDRSLEIRKSDSMRMFFASEDEFAARERRAS
jgi:hypothetical protein